MKTNRPGGHWKLSIALVAGACTPALADVFSRVCLLTGTQETPPVATNALGAGRFEIDTCANTLNYRIVFSGLTSPETAAHIHGPAAPQVPAGIVHPLPLGTIKTGVWNYPEAMEADILAGRMYVNIHSAAFGAGEIRGQIVTHVAILDGPQETPPVPTNALGFGSFMFDRSAGTLTYYIAYGGLTSAEVAAHIHGFTPHGIPSGIVHPLPAGSPKTGVWTIPTANLDAVEDGLTYVNIHTANFGGGEIRGQIVSSVNPMDGGQETPPVPGNGAGWSLISLDKAGDRFGYDVNFTGMTSAEVAAHIHGYSPVGVPSGIVHPFTNPGRKIGGWAYGAANEANVLAGLTYANIHSANFGAGEIRGQLFFRSTQGGPCASCYPNCDNSTTAPILNVQDFTCFLQRYAAGDSYANCDNSTIAPVLNVQDFTCFLQSYAAGCP
jgi:hypothetical protein